ncbi:MAG: MnhB domain-containing protein [Coriobacteriia bacterium]|nr:MnhB domain-containing protein [Coriobacteriia bacterium]
MRDRLKIMPLLASLAALGIIATTIIGLPSTAPGLSAQMNANAETIGIKNVVTAVLLDFRGYDTLLEISVLMLATVAVLSLRVPPSESRRRLTGESGLLLGSLTRLLAPFMIVIAGFLVWVGSSGPGGAFQAGAVLGAGGILLALAGYDRPAWVRQSLIRVALTIGLLAFIAIALLPILNGGTLLEYPDSARKTLLLLLEGLLTLSIGASLASLFLASASRGQDGGGR